MIAVIMFIIAVSVAFCLAVPRALPQESVGKATTPASDLAPMLPDFNLTLATSTPTVDIPIQKQDSLFTLTLTPNGNSDLQFPCHFNLYSPQNIILVSDPLTSGQIDHCGVSQLSVNYLVASFYGLEGKYVKFYATVTDAHGFTVTSNSVTVEYYGNGLSPNSED